MIEMGKQYKTRDGREVRIYATDGGGPQSAHGAYLDDGKWIANTWNAHGYHRPTGGESTLDLIEVKPKRTLDVWLNMYEYGIFNYPTKDMADQSSSKDRIACLHIVREYEEGDGL